MVKLLENVENSLQPSKSCLDLLLIYVNRQIEILIEVPFLSQRVVGFVYGVEQVNEDDCNVYPLSVLNVSGSAWLRFRVTGPYGDAVIDTLHPSRDELELVSHYSTTDDLR